ncbi:NAD(P)-binding protein [Xylariaceae sp. AK1471]|nr:NAD(P)-binding protein [Xylariaceae sp. AK1471]
MANSTVVLITGVGRGLGNALAAAYLLRPNHTVIGSVRDAKAPKAQELNKLPTADGSRLVLISIENTSTTDAKNAAKDIETAGLDHIDIVISNTAVSHPPAPLDAVDTELLVDAFRINAVSSVLLFQAVHKLLAKASAPKWISVSSRPGSIGQTAEFHWYIGPYGMSKAAQNWFTSTINAVVESLTAFAIHLGFVQTDMGIEAARLGGIEKPPTTPQESSDKIIHVIDTATREKTAGKFIDVMTGEEYLW